MSSAIADACSTRDAQPITVVDVAPERGSFVVRIEAFEDTGARWELGLEEIERFQPHFQGGPTTRVAVLWRQRVLVERALMTFLETNAMNERFHEAEAVLLADPSNHAF